MESFSSTSFSKLDDDHAWSSQEWKTETTTYERSGRPDKTSWRTVRKVQPDHEEILLDGTAQPVRNGETLRDSSGRLGNVNRVNGQVRRRQKIFQRCRRRRRRTFYDLENDHVYNIGISSI